MDARETFSCTNTTKKKSKNKKRRFSDEQIKSLESVFEFESRLEARKKAQLAKELGLQPRQVAIWFQNKRARWKSKQLEKDYSILLSNYNSLALRFETLKKEKQDLLVQLQKLNKLIGMSGEEVEQSDKKAGAENISERNTKIGDRGKFGLENRGSLSIEKLEHVGIGVVSDEDSSIKAEEYFGVEEEPNLLRMVEPADGSLTSQEEWGSLGSDGLFDQPTAASHWWDFWA